MDNWLLIVVGVIFLICVVVGAIRGFFKVGLSLLSSVLTIIIVVYLAPFVGDFLIEYTPIDNIIQEQCVQVFMPEITEDILAGQNLEGSALGELTQEQLQNLNEENWESLGITLEDVLSIVGEIPLEKQIEEIEDSVFPKFVKEALLENNNAAVYDMLGVTSFPAYAASYIAKIAVNILAFLVTFILAIILVRSLLVAVDIIGELPVIGTLNHMGGAVLGFAVALILVWIIFLVLTIMYSTEIGAQCLEMIENDQILTMLYQWNPLLSKLMGL